jgi:hypothetical protein
MDQERRKNGDSYKDNEKVHDFSYTGSFVLLERIV